MLVPTTMNSSQASSEKSLRAALQYAEIGLSVIQCQPDKKPYISWTEYQTRSATPDEIRSWWSKWPNAMIGIVTGKISNLFVIDCDTEAGYEEIQKLIPELFDISCCRNAQRRQTPLF